MSEMHVSTALLLQIAGYLKLCAAGILPPRAEAAEYVDKIGAIVKARAEVAL